MMKIKLISIFLISILFFPYISLAQKTGIFGDNTENPGTGVINRNAETGIINRNAETGMIGGDTENAGTGIINRNAETGMIGDDTENAGTAMIGDDTPNMHIFSLGNIVEYDSFNSLISAFIKGIVAVSTPIIILILVYAGFQFVVAQGNQEKLQQAKRNLLWVFVGIMIVVSLTIIKNIISDTSKKLIGTNDIESSDIIDHNA